MSDQFSNEQREFCDLFKKLKDWCDDDPAGLPEYAQQDTSIGELCTSLHEAYIKCTRNDEREPKIVYSDLPSDLVKLLREYSTRYNQRVHEAALICDMQKFKLPEMRHHFEEMGVNYDEFLEKLEKLNDFTFKANRKQFGESSTGFVRLSDDLTNFLKQAVLLPDPPSSILDEARLALRALRDVVESTEIDFSDVFRRRNLMPEFFIPRHVSHRHHNTETSAPYELIAQATRAFIYGSELGAIALLRSLMEMLLVEHYGSSGRDLSEIINNTRKLPVSVTIDELHKLRKSANDILHGAFRITVRDDPNNEILSDKTVVRFIELMRDLIEGVPRWQTS
jgi:hypothetical protein